MWQAAQQPQNSWSTKKSEELLRRSELIDPVGFTAQSQYKGDFEDFAVISVGRNPFSDTTKYVSILVGGIGGAGTAQGIAALTRPELFHDRPLGGIIEVTVNPHKEWLTRFRDAKWNWKTSRYGLKDLKIKLQKLAGGEATCPKLSSEQLQSMITLVAGIQEETKGSNPNS